MRLFSALCIAFSTALSSNASRLFPERTSETSKTALGGGAVEASSERDSLSATHISPFSNDVTLEAALGVSLVDEKEIASKSALAANPSNPREDQKQPQRPSPPLAPLAKSSASHQAAQLEELASVVKIFVDTVRADFVLPWQVVPQVEVTGSGFAIEGKRILTNAHLVADQTRVLVRKHGNSKRFIARVLAVCHECDLALVTVEDASFWEGLKPMTFGGIPQLRETVSVIGYPTGGDQLSITEGVVSRVGVSKYIHSSLGLLTVQIDAAINPGNSGGPAVSRGKVIGVAFQGFSQMQNVGYIVPYPIIAHFLNDVTMHRQHTGFVSVGIKAQTMENEALKKSKGMDKIPKDALPENVTAEGVLVIDVDKVRSAIYAKGKILLPITRYGQLPESEGGMCLARADRNESVSSTATTQPCKNEKELDSTETESGVPPGDPIAGQRAVKEVDKKIIWQPEGWKPPERSPSVQLHSTLLQQDAGDQDSQPNQETESSTGKGGPGSGSAKEDADGSAAEDQPKDSNGDDKGETKDQSSGKNGEDENKDKDTDQKQASEGQDNQASDAGEDDKKEQTKTPTDASSNSQAASNPTEVKGENASLTVEEKFNKLFSEIVMKSRDDPELRRLLSKFSPFRDHFAASQTVVGVPRHLRVRPGSDSEGQAESKASTPTDEEKQKEEKQLQQEKTSQSDLAGGTAGVKLVGTEQSAAANAFPQPSGTADTKTNGQPETAISVVGIKVAGAPQSILAASNSSQPSETQATQMDGAVAIGVLKVEQHHFDIPLKNEGQTAFGQAASSETSPGTPLSATIHPMVDNPKFKPELLQEEEFFGLRKGDVLLSLGNYMKSEAVGCLEFAFSDIADDGTISFRGLERVSFSYAVTNFFNGETTFAYVLREGRIIKVSVPLTVPNVKIPSFSWDSKPSYFVYGGFVFSPLSKNLVQMKLQREVPHTFEYLLQKYEYQEKEGDEYVVLSGILASEVSVGYEQPPSLVKSVNGKEVRNMRDLVRLIEATTGEFVTLTVEINGNDGVQIVIDKTKAEQIQEKILRDHNIVRDRYPDTS